MRFFQGGFIVSAQTPEPTRADVLVDDDGVISKKSDALQTVPENAEIINCTGKILVPGMFDAHVHSSDLAKCAKAARKGGITGMALMPDTCPAIDTGHAVKNILEQAANLPTACKILQTGAISKQGAGAELAAIGAMIDAEVPMLTDSARAVSCPLLLRRAMEYAKEFDIPIASRGETEVLSKGGVMNEGEVSYQLGLPGIPSIAEEIGIERDVCIARYVGGKIHVQQVSTAAGLKAITRARSDGVQVTCEVSPHHLLFNEKDIGCYDTRFKTMPPLRTAADNEALIQGLIDGSIDMIATGHLSHSKYEITTDFYSAPFGVSWLENAFLALYNEFLLNQVFGWDVLIQRFSDAPRKLMNLPLASIETGAKADFFLFDPAGTTYIEANGGNVPYDGKTLQGEVESCSN